MGKQVFANVLRVLMSVFTTVIITCVLVPDILANTVSAKPVRVPSKKIMYDRTYDRIGWTHSGASIYNSPRSKDYIVAAIDEADISDAMDDYEKACAVQRYLSEKLEYADYATAKGYYKEDYAPFTDYCLLTGKAVCSGYAEAFQSMCCALGIECWYITGQVKTDDQSEYHAWDRVIIGGKQYYTDPCLGDRPGYPLCMSETLWATHTLEEEHETFWLSGQKLARPDR